MFSTFVESFVVSRHYSYSGTAPASSIINVVLPIIISVSVGALIIYVWASIALMKMFKKASVAGWKAWIPIVNTWAFLEMGGQKGWIALLPFSIILAFINPWLTFIGTIASLVATVFSIIAAYKIASSFNKNAAAYTLLYVFLGIVYISILGFGKSRWSITGGIPTTDTPVQKSPEINPSMPTNASNSTTVGDQVATNAPVEQTTSTSPTPLETPPTQPIATAPNQDTVAQSQETSDSTATDQPQTDDSAAQSDDNTMNE